MDTASFELGTLRLNGVVDLDTIPFLKFPSGTFAARRLTPTNDGSEIFGTDEEDSDESDAEELIAPVSVQLHKNYPNPFNPVTTISFDLRSASIVTLRVFNVIGQEVAMLANREQMDEGYYDREFDAGQLSSGIYFYRLDVQEKNENDEPGDKISFIDKMLLIK
jgi:hypothetical protein